LADGLGCTIEDLPNRGFEVTSAGLAAMRGEPAAAEAVAVAHELGADLTGHVSQPATPDLIARADLIIGMTAAHISGLEGLVGNSTAIRLLCGNSDLPDPIGGDIGVYQTCAGAIWQNLSGLIDELMASDSGASTP
jgi:protein-tyrosine phosphatase